VFSLSYAYSPLLKFEFFKTDIILENDTFSKDGVSNMEVKQTDLIPSYLLIQRMHKVSYDDRSKFEPKSPAILITLPQGRKISLPRFYNQYRNLKLLPTFFEAVDSDTRIIQLSNQAEQTSKDLRTQESLLSTQIGGLTRALDSLPESSPRYQQIRNEIETLRVKKSSISEEIYRLGSPANLGLFQLALSFKKMKLYRAANSMLKEFTRRLEDHYNKLPSNFISNTLKEGLMARKPIFLIV
jgi:hypothetical protein